MKTLLYLSGGLVAIEIICMLVLRWTASRQGRILQRHLAGRAMESLNESEREEVLSSVRAEFDPTVHRKMELLVITYHLPALASWGIVTRQSTTPPLYYFAVTMAFWLAVSVGVSKVIAMLRGA